MAVGQWVGADSGTRDPVGRGPRHRAHLCGGREGVGRGVLLPGPKQRLARGHPFETQHGHPWCRPQDQGIT